MSLPFEVSGTVIKKSKTKNGLTIRIFGEIHNDINNTFYETLNLDNKKIWVEHATVLNSLSEGEDVLFQNAKGSEYIWYTSVKQKRPIVCVDTRVENELPPRYIELAILEELNKMQENVSELEEITLYFLQYNNTFLKSYIPLVKTFPLQFLPHIRSMIIQVKEKINNIKNMIKDEKKWDFREELYEECASVYDLQVALSSYSVDAHIMNLISAEKEGEIYLFVGKNHAKRLAEFLKETYPKGKWDIIVR